ncbi:SusC/RagA family TonB-linked outer membrane protein [Pedobacter sp. LMG 31464]|uniref:SusC/RagA family TonB-linked outer membrane protein n=1 Tax=Pedobacter planticolens TaxID=2679964 RepID=A0A923IV28_9SPHI|nr:SusC/RagA family TonB-linked outer membrane protein [Pedobacter planticolens]MBB2144764.1 SusC/RagA family TonB-linked outer membrane protein [Pedobacter planticolens]
MNKTFTQHVALLWHHLRSESKDAEKHYTKQSSFNLIYSGIFCCKLILLSTLILAISSEKSFAQQTAVQNIAVKGKVVDDGNGQAMPGITIMDNARKVLGVTNEKGDFSVSIPKGASISFSMIGYTTIVRTFNEGQGNLVIRIKESSSLLNEVVVTTALGIKRSERALGYATTTLDSTAFTNAVSSNWTDALSGKVAGLNLVRNSGPSGSNKIILRGENNLTGDNEALIVIDGVVASSSSKRTGGTGGGAYGTSGDIMPADFGSALNDLNSEDIENVTVLKGPAASALYGQRGANGAIIITTKSANKNIRRLNITFTSNTAFEEIGRGPDIQQEYGAGVDGASYYSFGANADGATTRSTSSTWGPAFAGGSNFFQYDPATQTGSTTRTPWVAYPNPLNSFFKTGVETSNSVSLDGTVKNVGLRFSASHSNNEWIVPNTNLERTTASLSANTNLTKKLNLVVKATYNNRNSDNLPATGYGNQSLMYWFMFAHPNIDVNWYKNYWVAGQEGRKFVDITSSFPEGPYAISEQYLNGQRRNGVLGSIQANYKFTKELSLLVRSSIDYNHDIRETSRPYDAAGLKFTQGSFRVQDIDAYEINADFLLRYDKNITNDFKLSASAGGSELRNRYNKSELRADGLTIPGTYRLDNNLNPLISVPDTARYNINSLYGTVSLSYRSYLYLDLTGRQDWNSTLASPLRTDNVGFFYPSASLSFIASDFWKLPKTISYFKLRGSIAQVGSGGTTPYRTAYNYILAANGIYPGSAMTNPTILPNSNLKPLKTTTIEVGAELKLFKNRLNFDIAAYIGNTKNQILSRSVDRSTGYSIAIFNAGRVDNKGLEMSVNATPIQTKSFKWTVNGTFTANRNTIKELADSSVVLRTGPLGGAQILANVGGSLGDLYGFALRRSPDGQIIFDSQTGLASADQTQLKYLGNTMPKFRFSFGSGVTYKKISLNVLFDAQLGAVGHSLTFSRMASLGKLKITLPGRYNGIIGEGVIQNIDGTYSPNTAVATDIDAFYDKLYGSDQAEGSVFRTDFLKFREANLNYAFSPKLVSRLGLSKLSVGVYGRNLFTWSPWPAFDPEFGTLAGGDIVQGFETGQLPSTRTYGVRLVVGIN